MKKVIALLVCLSAFAPLGAKGPTGPELIAQFETIEFSQMRTDFLQTLQFQLMVKQQGSLPDSDIHWRCQVLIAFLDGLIVGRAL